METREGVPPKKRKWKEMKSPRDHIRIFFMTPVGNSDFDFVKEILLKMIQTSRERKCIIDKLSCLDKRRSAEVIEEFSVENNIPFGTVDRIDSKVLEENKFFFLCAESTSEVLERFLKKIQRMEKEAFLFTK